MTLSVPLIIAYSSMAIMLAFACIGSAIGVTMCGNTTMSLSGRVGKISLPGFSASFLNNFERFIIFSPKN